jgi:hypothetical protein
MLGYRSLGNRQKFNHIAGDTAGMRDQEFHDLKADGIAQCFEHLDQPFLLSAGNVQRAAGGWDGEGFMDKIH